MTTFEQLQQAVFAATKTAHEADSAWQAELDRRRINRWSLAASGETGSTLRELYETKLAADRKMRRANDLLRKSARN